MGFYNEKIFIFVLLFVYSTLFANIEPFSSYYGKWSTNPDCLWHDYEKPRQIAKDAGREAHEIGLWRYLISAPRPEDAVVSMWYGSNSYTEFRRGFTYILDPRWERYSENWDQVVPIIRKAFLSVTDWLLNEYDICLREHTNVKRPHAHYQRGLIYFDKGDTLSALNDMHAVVTITEAVPEMQLALGQAYNDANQFLNAIKVLSELIDKEPRNKEAYFERALAYFEIGDFSKSMEDYLASTMRPTIMRKRLKYKHLKFSLGISTGIIKGGLNSVYDFAPSLLSTFHGLGTGLWAFASNPIGLSLEFVEATHEIIEFIRENATAEIIATLIPELKECFQQWDNLDEQTKGYYLGYVIGHYGVDCLMWKGSLHAVKAFQKLKRANIALTFETACLSSHQAEEILASAKKFWQTREDFKAKCFLHIDKQNKHIPGAHNFKERGSEITISLEKIEKLTQKKLGSGIPEKGMHLGEIDYKEIVNFGEEIGIVFSKEGKNLGTTTWGKIHYDEAGGYHVVPVLPPLG